MHLNRGLDLCKIIWYHQLCIMERWLRGRKHLTANEAGLNRPRGFESLLLRIVHWKRGRVVEGNSLENCHGETHQEFESLRFLQGKISNFVGYFLFIMKNL